jgi:hypothetical protein
MRDDVWIQHEEQYTQDRRFASVWMPIVTVADEIPSYETDRQEAILEEDIEECIVRGVDHALVWEVGIDNRSASIHEEPQDTLRTISCDQTERISDEFCPYLAHEHPPTREREEFVWREKCISDDYEHTTYNECEDERDPVVSDFVISNSPVSVASEKSSKQCIRKSTRIGRFLVVNHRNRLTRSK